jgi:hypothetical protein
MVRVGGLMLKPLLAQPLPFRSSYILLPSLLTSSHSSPNSTQTYAHAQAWALAQTQTQGLPLAAASHPSGPAHPFASTSPQSS